MENKTIGIFTILGIYWHFISYFEDNQISRMGLFLVFGYIEIRENYIGFLLSAEMSKFRYNFARTGLPPARSMILQT